MNKPQNPKSIEDFFQDFLNNSKGLLLIVLVIGGFVLASGSFFQVETTEEAVVLWLGKYERTAGPGLNFKWPLLNRVIKVPIEEVHEESFGFALTGSRSRRRSFTRNRRPAARNYKEESLMLTGDLNVADVEWVVQYKISNPQEYLFKVRDPEKNIRDISQAVMRRVVGDLTVNNVLTVGRIEIESKVKMLMQEILNSYEMGVEILQVQLQDVNPPERVKPSFDMVNSAKQEQERAINMAEAERNKVIPAKLGQKEEKISKARGEAQALVNHAKGDATRFINRLSEYRKAPEITRTRLYLELMEDVMGRLEGLTIIDPEIKGVLPIFSGMGQDSPVRAQASFESHLGLKNHESTKTSKGVRNEK